MTKVFLKVPNINELHYRQAWMRDSKTMEYNAGFDLDIQGYNKNTGIIIKTDEEMLTWYKNWINKEPNKYFAYIYIDNIDEPIGEVYYYLNSKIYCMGIIIQNKYRGNGYSSKALVELEKIAFEKNRISELTDSIPIDRISAIRSFEKAGFTKTENINTDIRFNKPSESIQMIITKDDYFRRKNKQYD